MQEAIKNKQKEYFKKFMIYASKFSLISEVLFSAFYAKEDDILYKDLSHPDWQRFFKVFDFYEANDVKKFNKQYTNLCEFLALGNAFISKSGASTNPVQQFFGQARYAAYYLLFKKKRMEQFNMFMSNPDIDLCLKVYSIPETEFIQTITEVTLPYIKVHQVVYLPMLDDILTVENLAETAENFKNKKNGYSPIKPDRSNEEEKKKEKPDLLNMSSSGMLLHKKHYIEELHNSKNPMYLTKSRLYNPEKHVMVRILSPIEFPVDWKNRMIKHEMINELNSSKGDRANESFFSSFNKSKTFIAPNEQKGFMSW